MKNIFLYLVLIIFIQASCTEDDPFDILDQLPPITMTGENTFGCLVNGEVWLPKGGGNGFDFNPDAKYNESSGTLQLKAIIYDQAFIQEKISILSVFNTEGNHPLINGSGEGHIFYSIFEETYSDYKIDTNYPNKITITRLDKVNDILSGTFAFKAIKKVSNDTIIVNNGRFDINYHL